MGKKELHWIFSMVHRFTQNHYCTDYIYCCGILFRGIVALCQCLNGIGFEYSDETTKIWTSVYSLFYWHEGSSFGILGVYGITVVAISLHVVHICGVIFLFVFCKAKMGLSQIVNKYCSCFFTFFLVGGVSIYGEIVWGYLAFFENQNSRGVLEYLVLFCVVLISIFLAVEWGTLALLWNDIFWDSSLPSASFDSQLYNIIQQLLLCIAAVSGNYWQTLKAVALVGAAITGFAELYRGVRGFVIYKELVAKFSMGVQALLMTIALGFFVTICFGKSLTLFQICMIFCSGICSIFLTMTLFIYFKNRAYSAIFSFQRKIEDSDKQYFSFLVYQKISTKTEGIALAQILEEHSLLCDEFQCPCQGILDKMIQGDNQPEPGLNLKAWGIILKNSLKKKISNTSNNLFILKMIRNNIEDTVYVDKIEERWEIVSRVILLKKFNFALPREATGLQTSLTFYL